MSQPRSPSAYPLSMITAVETAARTSEMIIPCDNPRALRLRFNGLRGALRKAGTAHLIDSVSFLIQENPPALIIRHVDNCQDSLDIEKALEGVQLGKPAVSAQEEAEASLDRILSGIK